MIHTSSKKMKNLGFVVIQPKCYLKLAMQNISMSTPKNSIKGCSTAKKNQKNNVRDHAVDIVLIGCLLITHLNHTSNLTFRSLSLISHNLSQFYLVTSLFYDSVVQSA